MSTSASLDTLLAEGNVSFFGYRGLLPVVTKTKQAGRLRAYLKKETSTTARYERLSQIREEHSDVYFLDHEALKVLFAEFPASARYVLVPLTPRFEWLVAIPGLLRRLQTGFVSYEGTRVFRHGQGATTWIVLRHTRAEALHTRLSLSEEVGITGLLAHLRETKRDYVVLRFSDKLPALHREGGDLDLLVSDEDERAVKEYLKAHPGPIGIDVWTVSRISHNAITYYPPPLARRILAGKVEGPAGSFVPSALDALHSFAYHVLYHKGLFAGVPTTIVGLTTNPRPENDYGAELTRLAKCAGVEVALSMEALDEYLASVGWRPQLDTLAKIAPRNKWVWRRFFASAPEKEIGLSVIILKQGALVRNLADSMQERIRSYPGIKILRIKQFNDKEAHRAATELRGGVWASRKEDTHLLPAMALVVVDTHLARLSSLTGTTGGSDRGIRHLKKLLRSEFDEGKGSITHATDFTHEALEYLHVCFPGEEAVLRKEAEEAAKAARLPLLEEMGFFVSYVPRTLTYHLTRMRQAFRAWLVRFILEK